MTAAAASFPIRGLIEGFYGTPWTREQRLDMIGFLARVGMNTFVFAPKDDPFQRRRWREPYGEAELAGLAEFVLEARRVGVDFVFALSPGLSMQYSSREDLDRLAAKYEQVRAIGVSRFALLLDDIPARLQHESDRALFGSLVEAQVELIRGLERMLLDGDPSARLLVCPTVYCGRGDEDYIAALGRGIPASVDLLWTGREICSPVLETVDAERFARSTGRPPLYWDNFPVNDVAMTHELHLGPYLGREAGLGEVSRGLVANPMPQAEASKIGIASVAEYLLDPSGFDPEASWRRAVSLVAGERDAAAFLPFADALRGSALCPDDAPMLGEVLEAFAFDYSFGDRDHAVAELAAEAARMIERAEFLIDGELENAALQTEIRPWALQYRTGAAALRTVAELLGDGDLDAAGKAVVRRELEKFRAGRLRVFGDLLDMFLSDLCGEFER